MGNREWRMANGNNYQCPMTRLCFKSASPPNALAPQCPIPNVLCPMPNYQLPMTNDR
ncbi:hypothetical protein PI95_021220 [Hassallia byssoidea VB512170]|uniref:Uncharacterized protein n=1 Tax=Hassallia byssoidea VB512170 TaxID=1304833 RepID=A0A846HCA7_9CYAN|nr:hypothetical protein [Hassalia byssoidea]NEU75005.1 hypothetical protein [Hassalia byssoidea VB512170]